MEVPRTREAKEQPSTSPNDRTDGAIVTAPPVKGAHVGGLLLTAAYSMAIFTAAILLFVVEPMVGKLMLPWLGGSASVWNTCMVFFQVMLLCGYAYAHFMSTRFSLKMQVAAHVVVLLLATVSLPIRLSDAHPPSGNDPVAWLLLCLFLTVGMPFFAISATNPLLQSWFSRLKMARAADPYFLYVASNTGSLAGVACYPLLIEQRLRLSAQGYLFAGAYIILLLTIVVCGAAALAFSKQSAGASAGRRADAATGAGEHRACTGFDTTPVLARQLKWVALAAIPSSLMLGLTAYVTTDMASVPLFWAIPLGVYLISFVIMFANPSRLLLPALKALVPLFSLASFALLTSAPAMESYKSCQSTVLTGISVHILTLLVVACLCHGEIYRDRPDPRYLTKYYLLISIGGVAGSSLNAFLAPAIFHSAIEYPLVLGLAAVFLSLVPVSVSRRGPSPKFAFAIRLLAIAAVCLLSYQLEPGTVGALTRDLELPYQIAASILFLIGPATLLAIALGRGVWQYRLMLLVILASAIYQFDSANSSVVFRSRNFFGSLSLRLNKSGDVLEQWSGPTRHGQQYLSPNLRDTPTTYFSRSGPAGAVLESLLKDDDGASVAVIGLGTGTLASYIHRGETITFYEIDPDVIAIADKPLYFTYLLSARQRNACVKLVQGDGRVKMGKAPDNTYDIIILDAFSSDFIPTHLLTREAMAVYHKKLKKDGILLFHLSNKYYDLGPVVGNLMADAGLLPAWKNDCETTDEKDASEWMAAAQSEESLSRLTSLGFEPVTPRRDVQDWCDDFSNPLKQMRQRRFW